MTLPQLTDDYVDHFGDLKGQLVEYALSGDVGRHLRATAKERRQSLESGALTPEGLIDDFIFEYAFDDGSSLIDRYLAKHKNVDPSDAALIKGMQEAFFSIFEVTAAPGTHIPGLSFETLHVRCCHSDLDYQVVPTLAGGLKALKTGMFMMGRLCPIEGTGFWTPSGPTSLMPASDRPKVAEMVRENVLQHPQLSLRNPDYLEAARGQVARIHEAFVAANGSNVVFGSGKDVARKFAEASVGAAAEDVEAGVLQSSQQMIIDNFADSPLADDDDVLLYSHPESGMHFCTHGGAFAAALAAGADADAEALDLIREFLNDASSPPPLIEQLIVERLPASQKALASALNEDDFDWATSGSRLIAGLPGDHEPPLPLSIAPLICQPDQ